MDNKNYKSTMSSYFASKCASQAASQAAVAALSKHRHGAACAAQAARSIATATTAFDYRAYVNHAVYYVLSVSDINTVRRLYQCTLERMKNAAD